MQDNKTTKRTTYRAKPHKTLRKLNLLRLTIVICVFIALAFVGATAGLVMYSSSSMPAWDPTALQPNLPSYILDKDGNEITKIFVENRVPIKFEEVPDTVKGAFLAIEDVRFYDHNGLDLRRIVGAVLADIKAGKAAQGASTITQQLVKRAFLSPEKTIKRKIQEAILAIKLERKFTKNEIFEMYLNQIYFGEGAYGIQSASQVYFGKEAKKLNLEEAAMLAGLPKAPNSYDPFKNLESATKRRNTVLDSMSKFGFVTEDQAESAKAKKIALSGTKTTEITIYQYPYFVDYVTELLIKKYGEEKVYKGGLRVSTTLDPKIQKAAEEAMSNSKNFPKSKADKNGVIQPQAAVVVLDPHTGYIKAVVGGRDHKQKRQFNRAIDALRQPGSTFKPVAVYGPAFEKGKAPADVVDDSVFKTGSKTWKNYDGKFRGPITYRKAVALSVNIAAVKVMKETGVEKGVAFAKKLGITSIYDDKDTNLSTALGGLTTGVSPLELAGAYGAFANEGVFVQPTAITKITDRNGNIIEQSNPKKTIAMKKTTAYLMTDVLRTVVTSGTGAAASLGGRPVAGKTGTTSDDKDAWFAGFTQELVAVVWIGHDDPKHMNRIYGGSFPAKIWKSVMTKALKDVPVKNFHKPSGLVSGTVCSKSGNKPGDLCPKEDLVSDIFAKGTLPSKVCDAHNILQVCAESLLLPAEGCPQKTAMAFIKGKEPKEVCNLHKGITKPSGVAVCVDPSHGGILYLANIPGQGEEGGCPSSSVDYTDFAEGQAPSAHCTIPEHQIRPAPVTNPDQPTDPTTTDPNIPTINVPTKPVRNDLQ
jgi:penicillin-binding protein 1A